MRDKQIDYSDIPEVTDFTGFRRGPFNRAAASDSNGEPVTVRLDTETLAWFRAHAANPASVEGDIAAALASHVRATKTPT